jgi:hypothetical protein
MRRSTEEGPLYFGIGKPIVGSSFPIHDKSFALFRHSVAPADAWVSVDTFVQ